MIKNFGQRIELSITGSNGEEVITTDGDNGIGLRVDFDLHMIYGYGRGTIRIYNLSPESIKEINNGERYVSLRAKLHGIDDFLLVDEWIISNSLEEKKLPESVLSLYCYDKLRKNFLEKYTKVVVKRPSLSNVVKKVVESVGFSPSNVKFKHFPEGAVDRVPSRPATTWNGSVEACLIHHSKQHDYDWFAQNNKIILMHKPNLATVSQTSIQTDPPDITLDSNNMRANPILGPAQLQVTSNLDGNITPTSLLDITQLITFGTNANEQTLQIGNEFLEKSTLGYPKYQVLSVQHRGSNYTSQWETIVDARAPKKGTTMPTQI